MNIDEFIDQVMMKDFDDWVRTKKNVKEASYSSSLDLAFNHLKENNASEVELNFKKVLTVLLKEDRIDEIKKLVGFLRCTICKIEWRRNDEDGALDNAKTYLKSFLDYAEKSVQRGLDLTNIVITDGDRDYYRQLVSNALKNRAILSHENLRKKFKSRLRCQDRTSGDKIWLPLRFIAKIYNTKGQKGKISNDFTKWLDTLVDNVYIHYLDNNTVKSAKFENKKLYLELYKEDGETEFKVNVILSRNARKGHYFPALTPTGKGNKKELMKTKSADFASIAIDHIIPIDRILKTKEESLPNLKEVSKVYKKLLDKENDTLKDIKDSLDEIHKKLNLDDLIKELKLISDEGPLRLMDSEYNSQKSNGETFQKIIMTKKRPKKYVGIIEGEGIIFGDNDKEEKVYYYYQELTNSFINENNRFRVSTTNPSESGDEISTSEEIINYI